MQSTSFGTLPDGRAADLFTLRNHQGLEARISNYGGIITHLFAPDRHGKQDDIVLGFSSLERYLAGHPYFGAIVGRVAGRLGNARFQLDGKSYTLADNDPPNHLHGGLVGLDKRLWQAEQSDEQSLRLSYRSPDGEEGYPGNVDIAVEYSITDDNGLRIDYFATTDRPTPLSLTNHSYFNLAGEGSGKALQHELEILADEHVPTDDSGTLLNRAEPVDGRPNDFRFRALLSDRIDQLHLSHGDNYLLGPTQVNPRLVARLHEPATGRLMETLTTAPCLQFYTGKYLDETLVGKAGQPYQPFAGLCFEAQGYPDAPNCPDFETITITPKTPYRQTALYRFSIY